MEGYTPRISRRQTTEERFYALVSTRNASIRRYTRLLQETVPSDQHMVSIVRQFDDLRDEWWQAWKSTIPPTPATDVMTVRVAHHGPLRSMCWRAGLDFGSMFEGTDGAVAG